MGTSLWAATSGPGGEGAWSPAWCPSVSSTAVLVRRMSGWGAAETCGTLLNVAKMCFEIAFITRVVGEAVEIFDLA